MEALLNERPPPKYQVYAYAMVVTSKKSPHLEPPSIQEDRWPKAPDLRSQQMIPSGALRSGGADPEVSIKLEGPRMGCPGRKDPRKQNNMHLM